MAILTSADESVVKKQFHLGSEPVIIGRHPECDVHIEDGSVSRRHAQITYEDGHFFVSDLNSRNGTLLNDQPIHRPTKLYDRSTIQICDIIFEFWISDTSHGANTLGANTSHGTCLLYTSPSPRDRG